MCFLVYTNKQNKVFGILIQIFLKKIIQNIIRQKKVFEYFYLFHSNTLQYW